MPSFANPVRPVSDRRPVTGRLPRRKSRLPKRAGLVSLLLLAFAAGSLPAAAQEWRPAHMAGPRVFVGLSTTNLKSDLHLRSLIRLQRLMEEIAANLREGNVVKWVNISDAPRWSVKEQAWNELEKRRYTHYLAVVAQVISKKEVQVDWVAGKLADQQRVVHAQLRSPTFISIPSSNEVATLTVRGSVDPEEADRGGEARRIADSLRLLFSEMAENRWYLVENFRSNWTSQPPQLWKDVHTRMTYHLSVNLQLRTPWKPRKEPPVNLIISGEVLDDRPVRGKRRFLSNIHLEDGMERRRTAELLVLHQAPAEKHGFRVLRVSCVMDGLSVEPTLQNLLEFIKKEGLNISEARPTSQNQCDAR